MTDRMHVCGDEANVFLLILLIVTVVIALPSSLVYAKQSLTFNYEFNRTLGRFDTVSSTTYYSAVQSSNIRVDSFYVNCAAKITGPYWATFRIQVQALQQSVRMYFEYWRVAANWEGTAEGWVDFIASSWTSRVNPPAAENTGISVNFPQNMGSANSGQLDTQIQLWAEVIPPTQITIKQCSWQIDLDNSQPVSEIATITTTAPGALQVSPSKNTIETFLTMPAWQIFTAISIIIGFIASLITLRSIFPRRKRMDTER